MFFFHVISFDRIHSWLKLTISKVTNDARGNYFFADFICLNIIITATVFSFRSFVTNVFLFSVNISFLLLHYVAHPYYTQPLSGNKKYDKNEKNQLKHFFPNNFFKRFWSKLFIYLKSIVYYFFKNNKMFISCPEIQI